MSAPPMSRSSSFSSISSDSTSFNSFSAPILEPLLSSQSTEAENENEAEPSVSWPTLNSKRTRTRKRFAHEQLIVLEDSYHKASHPDKLTRQMLADQIGVDIKSVTIWFQNKRQTKKQIEKRYALRNSNNSSAIVYPVYFSGPTSLYSSGSYPCSFPALRPTTRIPQRSVSGYLSLDHIASRAELPNCSPRTPRKLARHASYAGPDTEFDALWDVMPSSPPRSTPDKENHHEDGSPSAKDYLRFASTHASKGRTRSRRTLEWACAAARAVPDKTGTPPRCTPVKVIVRNIEDDDSVSMLDYHSGEETEIDSDGETHEALTPSNSQVMTLFSSPEIGTLSPKATKGEDTEIMDAALALCGLRG